MAQPVIDLLEMIDVDDRDAALALLDRQLFDLRQQAAPVGDAGQRVFMRRYLQFVHLRAGRCRGAVDAGIEGADHVADFGQDRCLGTVGAQRIGQRMDRAQQCADPHQCHDRADQRGAEQQQELGQRDPARRHAPADIADQRQMGGDKTECEQAQAQAARKDEGCCQIELHLGPLTNCE